MKQKSIHQILVLMYDEYVKDIDPVYPAGSRKHFGLCGVIIELEETNKITAGEGHIMERYLYNNRPKRRSNYAYFWVTGVRRYRLQWMKKHIEKTK